MTLDDALVERYSRQILLPEVGGRGQERLCATLAIVAGGDETASFVADLLASAGVRVTRLPGSPGELSIDLGDARAVLARVDRTGGVVVTLAGRPCRRCVAAAALASREDGAATVATAQVVGSLAAAEALRLALGLAAAGRVQTIDLEGGRFDAAALATTSGCAACRDAG